ncbi:hypothetical protein [Marinitenerispora sediminis]|uniref:Uncharacterized protein n=1 Tax=Marinitenerispora sediminis TaxID=1931232 RepID=A0A368T177_9ACTN|nr:hypothetical protein [Marinitenerispora sediminis]RCV53802.1 hypothetical protein DEF24_20090 [Marinitenerispora sediminis]RCV55431.1 hypothetical protein DEF28_05790 [Marinitenerispora sediminis]RCV61728.1 hypothetical protein DEF23_01230 [Marinitenerispora sediminis]
MSQNADIAARELSSVTRRLRTEFEGVHREETVLRCVKAARQGALEVTGRATADMVERIARQHLRVLALAFAEHG